MEPRPGKPVAAENFASVSIVEVRKFDIFIQNILPYIQFCPVADGEHLKCSPMVFFPLKIFHSSGRLVFGIPLTEFISVRKESLLCPCFLLIAPASADCDINFQFLDCIKKCY